MLKNCAVFNSQDIDKSNLDFKHLRWQDRLPKRAAEQLGNQRPDGFFGPVVIGPIDLERGERETLELIKQVKILEEERGRPASIDDIFDELSDFIYPKRHKD